MAAKYYHILAFLSRDEGMSNQALYMGKTSDLSFKTEADKTIDCDDGSTETGSEKLTLQFSILGKLINNWDIAMLWLVPIRSTSDYMYSKGEILKIYLGGGDYRIENKSGEFEKVLFHAELRYPADSPQYSYDANYFDNNCILLGRVNAPEYNDILELKSDNTLIVSADMKEDIIEGSYAFAFVPDGIPLAIWANGTNLLLLDEDESIGVVQRDVG
ncbi:MAG: hypothetical protein PHY48_12755 [Candidatus Cloacimonetes bacterium]|jgi:hypothetical protein|nr:hypothetical protein [Candidatus Cloacimonadota bacterium]MDD2230268.1 hypothetical protein [Candidatus Cloacimonadota bacterium]